MSATNRGAQRNVADFYPTPHWCTRAFLKAVKLPDGVWLEPCAGDGDIMLASRHDDWVANDIRWPHGFGDTLTWNPGCRFVVGMTNPPFSLAMEFILWTMQHCDHVVVFLRLNFLASAKRAAFFQEHHPDVYVLPNRPSLNGTGKTDATEYAWFHFHKDAAGIIRVLPPVSKAERSLG